MIETVQRRIPVRRWFLLFCLAVVILPGRVPGETISGAEYPVKLGFIYHFIRFTQWPPETFETPESPITFCVAATHPEAATLFSLQGRKVKGRRIDVQRYAGEADATACQVLFIASGDQAFVQPILDGIQGRQVLSIGEVREFTRMGGVINFFVEQDQLRFEVNLDAAESAGLKFSSQLLMSADIVKKRKE